MFSHDNPSPSRELNQTPPEYDGMQSPKRRSRRIYFWCLLNSDMRQGRITMACRISFLAGKSSHRHSCACMVPISNAVNATAKPASILPATPSFLSVHLFLLYLTFICLSFVFFASFSFIFFFLFLCHRIPNFTAVPHFLE